MELIGKVVGINTSDGVFNLAVSDNTQTYNLKIQPEDAQKIIIGHVYSFKYDRIDGERVTYIVTDYQSVMDFADDLKEDTLRTFFPSSPINSKDSKKEIDKYLALLDNHIIKEITEFLLKKYENDFFLYPAASKLHHAYVSGLAYHCIGMLHLADGFIMNYPYLDKNYVYAGIILHDIGKLIELTGVESTEYSLRGQMIGHLVLGAIEIDEAAKQLGYADTKEVLVLEHMLVSHHGQPQFGSCKKPMIAEALVLWYIDTIDSKFRVLGEELAKTASDSYTENIGVLDRMKIYKL